MYNGQFQFVSTFVGGNTKIPALPTWCLKEKTRLLTGNFCACSQRWKGRDGGGGWYPRLGHGCPSLPFPSPQSGQVPFLHVHLRPGQEQDGMPLAFTQEDCLVVVVFFLNPTKRETSHQRKRPFWSRQTHSIRRQ